MLSRAVPAAALLLLSLASPGAAQRAAAATVSGSSTLWEQNGRGTLDSEVRVALEDASIPEALTAVARAAGLDLAYVSDVLPAGVRVSRPGDVTTARAAFEQVLAGTGLRVTGPTASGHFVVVAAHEGTEAGAPEDGTVVGRVYERSGGEPIGGVDVFVEGTDLSSVSGPDGRFTLAGVPAGTRTLHAASIGYADETRTVDVEDGATLTVDFALETSAVSMDEIVVTGTVTPTPVKALPTPITIVRATDIERLDLESVDELFRVLIPGGVQAIYDAGPGGSALFSVRGTSSLTDFSTIKILLDGIEMENPTYIKSLDPASIERVEFIAGPQASAIYGSGAISGVMQIFTRKGVPGQRRPTVSGMVGLGTIDDRWVEDRPLTQEYRLSVHGGAESYGYNLGGSWEQDGSWIPGSQDRAASLYGGTRLELGDVTAGILLRYRGDFDDPGLDPRGALVYGSSLDAPSTSRRDWHSQSFGLNLAYDASERWSHELVLGYDGGSHEQYTTEPRRSTPTDTFNTLSRTDRRKLSLRYNTSVLIPLGGNDLTLVGGGDYANQSVADFGSTTIPPSNGPVGSYSGVTASRNVQTLAGAFAQGQLGLTDRLFLTLGVHGDMSEGEDGVAWSPRVGASFVQPLREVELKLRAAYGSALIAPEPTQKVGQVSQFFSYRPNPGLLPERQVGYDAGVELYWGNRASFSLTYFDQTAEDLVAPIFLDFVDNRSILQYQNVGRIENSGWEASATLVPQPDLQLTAVFGKTTSEVAALGESYSGALEPGDAMPRVPGWTAGATLAWSPVEGTSLTGTLTHRASWVDTSLEDLFTALFSGTYTGNEKDYWIEYEPITRIAVGVEQRLTSATRAFFRVENLTNNYNFEVHDALAPRGREMQMGVRFTLN